MFSGFYAWPVWGMSSKGWMWEGELISFRRHSCQAWILRGRVLGISQECKLFNCYDNPRKHFRIISQPSFIVCFFICCRLFNSLIDFLSLLFYAYTERTKWDHLSNSNSVCRERLGYFCRKYVERLNLRKLLVSAAVTKHVVCFGIWSSCHAEILFLFHGEIRISVGFVFFEVL